MYNVINTSLLRESDKVIFIIMSIIKLLKKSKIKVRKASNLFPVLSTFVAPILPDPIFLISPYPKTWVIITPKGIEPSI